MQRLRTMLLGVVGLLAVLAFASPSALGATRPLQTALIDYGELDRADADVYLQHVRDSGATAFRTMLLWYQVVPDASAATRPAGFDPANPNDPGYHWEAFDRKIRLLKGAGLEPIVIINFPPVWAGGGFTPSPDPLEAALFARAAAEHYSGRTPGVPRVRYWMVWNEANVTWFFSPQFDASGKAVSPELYRRLVNEVADAVHGVNPSNRVIAGGLSPYGVLNPPPWLTYLKTIPPLAFMRQLLSQKIKFDIWAHHPYTHGGPRHHADKPDDISLGDLPKMRRLLDAAAKAGRVVSRGKVQFWATEFSWDTNPPDPKAVPVRLQARWVSEGLYWMWKNGMSMVAWLTLRDFQYPYDPIQAGLYYTGGPWNVCDTPKLGFYSFRFPFVAYKQRRGLLVWGRTPWGRPGRVAIERTAGKRWKRVATLRTDGAGIFTRTLKAPLSRGSFRDPSPKPWTYSQLVMCDGASAYWRLDERSGATAVDQTRRNHGQYLGGVALGTPGALKGEAGTAATFDGVDDKVDIGPIAQPKTVEFWVKMASPKEGGIFSNRGPTNRYTYVGSTKRGGLLVFDRAALLVTSSLGDDKWHYVVYRAVDGKAEVYVDTHLVGETAWEQTPGGGPGTLGWDGSINAFFRGSLDEIAVYENPISLDQMRRHFAAAEKPFPRGVGARVRGSYFRARLLGTKLTSLPFSSARVPDRTVKEFG